MVEWLGGGGGERNRDRERLFVGSGRGRKVEPGYEDEVAVGGGRKKGQRGWGVRVTANGERGVSGKGEERRRGQGSQEHGDSAGLLGLTQELKYSLDDNYFSPQYTCKSTRRLT